MNQLTIQTHVTAVEEAYEFFLAYAAQGLKDDRGSSSGSELRRFLDRLDNALNELESAFRAASRSGTVTAPKHLDDMIDVLARDAQATRAAVKVVSSRSKISSQLIDNFNASIHVRALLTDIFLLDEAMKNDD